MKYQRVLLIVGAGASKGAHLHQAPSASIATPPLDAEFLNVAQMLFSRKGKSGKYEDGKKIWKKLITYLDAVGLRLKVVSNWRLETLTTYLEARANVNFENQSGRPVKHRDALEMLNQVVCHVLLHTGGTRQCPIHERIVEFLNPRAIISFNYGNYSGL